MVVFGWIDRTMKDDIGLNFFQSNIGKSNSFLFVKEKKQNNTLTLVNVKKLKKK